jgi:hypothetical protein
MALMEPITPEYTRLREAITERLNAHDLIGVMDHGAPATEYDPEMEDFAALIAAGTPHHPGGRGDRLAQVVRRQPGRQHWGAGAAHPCDDRPGH